MRTALSVVLTDCPPGPAGPIGLDPQVTFVDLDLDLFSLGQDRHGGRRGVDPPARLGHGDALDAVHAALELQAGIGAVPSHLGDDLLEPARRALAGGEQLDAPPPALRVAAIHPEQVGREQRRLRRRRSLPGSRGSRRGRRSGRAEPAAVGARSSRTASRSSWTAISSRAMVRTSGSGSSSMPRVDAGPPASSSRAASRCHDRRQASQLAAGARQERADRWPSRAAPAARTARDAERSARPGDRSSGRSGWLACLRRPRPRPGTRSRAEMLTSSMS